MFSKNCAVTILGTPTACPGKCAGSIACEDRLEDGVSLTRPTSVYSPLMTESGAWSMKPPRHSRMPVPT